LPEGNSTQAMAEDVSRVLRRCGFRVEFISYPSTARSIDIVASRSDFRVLVKVTTDLKDVSWMEANDLKKSGSAYNSRVIIVAEKNSGKRLESDVLYVKNGVNAVTPEMFEDYFLRNNKPLVVNIKGNYLLKLSTDKFQERKREAGLTRGALAEMLGVSRKTIYMYEKGELMISLQKGIELAKLMGEDIFEEIDIFEEKIGATPLDTAENEVSPSDEVERTILGLLSRLYGLVVKLSRTPADLAARGKTTVTIARLDTVEEKAEKLDNAEKLARITGSKLITIKRREDISELYENAEDDPGI